MCVTGLPCAPYDLSLGFFYRKLRRSGQNDTPLLYELGQAGHLPPRQINLRAARQPWARCYHLTLGRLALKQLLASRTHSDGRHDCM